MTTLQTTHHEGSIRPQGKNSRFRQQSGIFSVKNSSICVCGLRKNLSTPMYGNTVVIAVPLVIGGNVFAERTARPHNLVLGFTKGYGCTCHHKSQSDWLPGECPECTQHNNSAGVPEIATHSSRIWGYPENGMKKRGDMGA